MRNIRREREGRCPMKAVAAPNVRDLCLISGMLFLPSILFYLFAFLW